MVGVETRNVVTKIDGTLLILHATQYLASPRQQKLTSLTLHDLDTFCGALTKDRVSAHGVVQVHSSPICYGWPSHTLGGSHRAWTAQDLELHRSETSKLWVVYSQKKWTKLKALSSIL